MQARQKIDLIELTGPDGVVHGILLDPQIIPVWPRKERIFQGWRYLEVANILDDIPADASDGEALPVELAAELRDLGLL